MAPASQPSTTPPPREASSTPAATPDTHDATSPNDKFTNAPPAELPNVDTLIIDDPVQTVLPDQIGHLHSLGLDYGWGPTSILQWTMEHAHVWGGLPWWGSIAVASIVLRSVLFPLYIRSSDIMARQQAMNPVLKPITDRMTAARKRQDMQEVQLAFQHLRAVRKKAGISTLPQFMPIMLQGIFGYCGFKLLRAAALLPVPEFKTGGFSWLADLTVPDPYLILPLTMAGVLHFLVRSGGETAAANANQMAPGMHKFMLYGMPVIALFATGWVPGAVAVWFAAGGALGVLQSLAFRNETVRAYLGIAPIYKPPPGQEYKSPMNAWVEERFGKKKSDAIDVKATVKTDSLSATSSAGTSGRATATGAGRNEVFMRPSYQKPNLRFTSPARASSSSPQEPDHETIDMTEPLSDVSSTQPPASSSSDEMIPPSGKTASSTPPGGEGGVLDRASRAWKQTRQKVQNKTNDYIEKRSDEAGYTGEGTGNVQRKMQEREDEIFKRRNEEYEKRRKAKNEGGGKKKKSER